VETSWQICGNKLEEGSKACGFVFRGNDVLFSEYRESTSQMTILGHVLQRKVRNLS
jgi:hypothetical protein